MTDLPLVDTPEGKIFERRKDCQQCVLLERRKDCQQCVLLERRMVIVEGAFPDGPEKHAAYHLAKINAAKEEAEFWKSAKLELTKNGVAALFGVIKIVLTLAALGLLYKLGLGPVADSIIK